MTAYIIRHGEKDTGYYWNDTLQIKDNPLNERGVAESIALVLHLLKLDIGTVYVSEYRRARETITPFCDVKNIRPRVTSLLNEIDMGSFNRIEDKDAKQKYFDRWDEFQRRRRDFRYKGGEKGKEVLRRVGKFFQILESEKANAVVVTHEGWIKLSVCHICGIDAGKRFFFGTIPTCGILEIEYEEGAGKWKINFLNRKEGRIV